MASVHPPNDERLADYGFFVAGGPRKSNARLDTTAGVTSASTPSFSSPVRSFLMASAVACRRCAVRAAPPSADVEGAVGLASRRPPVAERARSRRRGCRPPPSASHPTGSARLGRNRSPRSSSSWSGKPLHDNAGEVLPPSATCARGQGAPSLMSGLDTSKVGTAGSFWYSDWSVKGHGLHLGAAPLAVKSSGASCRRGAVRRPALILSTWRASSRSAITTSGADYVSLRDVELRTSLEADHGFFVAEGEKVVRRAVAAGYSVRSFLMARRWLAGLRDELERAAEAPCYVVGRGGSRAGDRLPRAPRRVGRHTLDELVGVDEVIARGGSHRRTRRHRRLHQRRRDLPCRRPWRRGAVVAAVRRPAVPTVDQGGDGRGLRSPWTRLPTWYDALPALADAGFTTVALTPAPDAVPLDALVGRLAGASASSSAPRVRMSGRWLASADLRAADPDGQRGRLAQTIATAAAIATRSHRAKIRRRAR